jgi:Domain of unknown function (DUF5666)
MRPTFDLRPSRLLLVAGLPLILTVGVVIGATTVAARQAPAAPSVAQTASVDDSTLVAETDLGITGGDAPAAAARRPGLLRLLVGRTERAEITVSTSDGTRTILYVRGEIASVSGTSIKIGLVDGTTQAFAIDATTRIREKGKDIKVSDLAAGERAMVFGTKNADGTYAAKLIRCVRERANKPAASPSGG